MKRVPLTRGKFALVDDVDFVSVVRFNWHAMRAPNTFYAARHGSRKSGQPYIYMHRMLLGCAARIDHRNGDGLDNRRSNLRPATHSQNLANRPMVARNSSGFKGISRHWQKWTATITVNYRRCYLGLYDAPEAAAIAYMFAAVLYFGEFANTSRRRDRKIERRELAKLNRKGRAA